MTTALIIIKKRFWTVFMRRLFADSASAFFKEKFEAEVAVKGSLGKLMDQLDKQNILRSKILGLLPKGDLAQVAGQPCPIPRNSKETSYLNKISAFKRIRAFLDIDEVSVCERCPRKGICPLRDKVPDQKVTSSRDVFELVFFHAREAAAAERRSTAQEEADAQEFELANEKPTEDTLLLLEKEADRQEMSQKLTAPTEGPEESLSAEEEFTLYLSAFRLVDSLPLIMAPTIDSKKQLQEVLEKNILDYSIKKKVDIVLSTKQAITRTASKKKTKRDEGKGIGELLDITKRSLDHFAKPFTSTQEKTSK
jgi:hypothetical protein